MHFPIRGLSQKWIKKSPQTMEPPLSPPFLRRTEKEGEEEEKKKENQLRLYSFWDPPLVCVIVCGVGYVCQAKHFFLRVCVIKTIQQYSM